jgi:hypothetical protein
VTHILGYEFLILQRRRYLSGGVIIVIEIKDLVVYDRFYGSKRAE